MTVPPTGVFVARPVRANRGDMASQAGLVRGLARLEMVDTVHVSTHYPNHYQDDPKIQPMTPPALRGYATTRAEQALLGRGLPVYWGGGVDLQDTGSKAKLVLLLIRFWLLRRNRSPLVLACQGAGPLRSGIGKALARKILALVDFAVLREKQAALVLKDAAGNAPPPIIQAADAALMLTNPGPDVGAAYLTGKGFDVTAPVVGVNIRRWFHQTGGWLPTEFRRRRAAPDLGVPMKRLVENLARSLNKLAESGLRQVALVPMYRAQPEFWEDDIYLLQALRTLLDARVRSCMVDEDLSPDDLLSIFSCFEFAVGVRLHSTILAHVAGTPAVHLYYEDKGPEHFRQVGSDKSLISIDTASGPGGEFEIDRCVERLRNDIEAARSRLRGRVEALRTETEAALRDSLVAVLGAADVNSGT